MSHLKASLSQSRIFVLEEKHVLEEHADILRRQNRFEISDTTTCQRRHKVLLGGVQYGKNTVFRQFQLLTIQVPFRQHKIATATRYSFYKSIRRWILMQRRSGCLLHLDGLL